jgi:hypothetical protein
MGYHLRDVIAKPEHQHGVGSEEAYLDHARRFLLRHGLRPALVREVAERPHAYVSGGAWVVKCGCGNAPSAHPGGEPGWPRPIAVCLECGAVTRPIFPKDWAAAEEALLERPDPSTRHFFPHKDHAAWVGETKAQTVAYLRKENADQGETIERDRRRFPRHREDGA